ncbi:MAG: dipeptide epimerase [Rhodanobacter sp.]|jgi:L-alanine-DL-glutamate epimerase-like enolase superfamily enzyme|nr:dipeptide epimerase [Rhodanobacter sp.]OJW37117.1 MAG: dipeptide epimerase [Rhodanobacter sp. 67-28]
MQTEVRHERWELAAPFVIAHETYLHADVIVATLSCDGAVGRGECTPTAFYGESVDGVMKTVRELLARLARGESWDRIHDHVPAGAARNAVDCAFWDLRAKLAKQRVWELIGVPAPGPVRTAQTISVGEAAQQADKARAIVATDGDGALIKLKLDAHDVVARVAAVRDAAPAATLVIDANESWDPVLLAGVMPALQAAHVAMVEQPLPVGKDDALARIERRVPVCADESAHVGADLDALRGRYDLVNVKLDKTGGLTEALRMTARARQLGFGLMVGCMEGTSLGMAPATLVAGAARFVDLDGPLLIGRDRDPGLHYQRGLVSPPSAALWG